MKYSEFSKMIECNKIDDILNFISLNNTDNNDSEFYNLKGVFLYNNGEYIGAKENFEKAIRLDSNNKDAIFNLKAAEEFLRYKKDNIIIVNNDSSIIPKEGNSIFESRENISNCMVSDSECELSIGVLAYNRVEKTKTCVESLIEHTKDVDFELVLVDNGSTDDSVLDYFLSVDYKRKTIIKITKNLESTFGVLTMQKYLNTKFSAIVPNDIIITDNCISNLLKCIKSDKKVGFVCPVSSNVSNMQEVNLHFENEVDMHKKAKQFNISDPNKWEERIRLIPLVYMYRRECQDVVGVGDYGFFHDFGDDDLSFRYRRAGYKIVLCRDTWVHHNHDFRNAEDKVSQEAFISSLAKGRENFKEKYYGLDAWDDAINFENGITSLFEVPRNASISILGIDVKCGASILDLKNKVNYDNRLNTTITSYTTDAKYYLDLCTISNFVYCDKIENISHNIFDCKYDCIIVGEYINSYNNFESLVKILMEHLNNDGVLLFRFKNVYDYTNYLKLMGYDVSLDDDKYYCKDIDKFIKLMNMKNVKFEKITRVKQFVTKEMENKLRNILKTNVDDKKLEEVFEKLVDFEYCFSIKKF